MQPSADKDESTKFTILDNRVSVVIPGDGNVPTASFRSGISTRTERLHRLHGATLMMDACSLLGSGAATYATACVIFHRFFQQVSLQENDNADVWSVSAAATLLAAKVEEDQTGNDLKKIIPIFNHLYRMRLLFYIEGEDEIVDMETLLKERGTLFAVAKPQALQWSATEKKHRLEKMKQQEREGPAPQRNQYRDMYRLWQAQITKTEASILRQLGFTLHWIPDSHPHKFILYFIQVLELAKNPQISQRAWNYCNDSCQLDLCLRIQPEIVACAAVLLATKDLNVKLPLQPSPWWEVLVGPIKGEMLATATNAILGLVSVDGCNEELALDSVVAKHGFVLPMNNPHFHGPASQLWKMTGECFSTTDPA